MQTIVELENEIQKSLKRIFVNNSYSRFTGTFQGDKKILGEHIYVVFYTWSVYNKQLGIDVERIFKDYYCKSLKLHKVKKQVVNDADQTIVTLVFEN